MLEQPRARVGSGPRAVEALLCDELDRLDAQARAEPALLARAVRVVVPSKSLAQHLAATLARRAGRPLLGVSIRTLHALACEIVQRAGQALPAGEGLFDLWVRRLAREEPALAALAELVDGHAVVAASVRDLLDAGLEPEHEAALEELLEAERGEGELALRARAVVRIACRVAREIERGAFGHRSRLFRLAREILERDPAEALRARAILIHGFADATGVVTDLLEALVRRAGALLFLDRPRDPAEPDRLDAGVRFGERFATRVLGAAPPDPGPAERSRLRVLHAAGAWSEARAAAEEIRAALDAGHAPERIGIVARELSAHRLALRAQLDRLAIPFSGLGEPGPPGPVGRRLAELLVLLREGPRARVETWLEALGSRATTAPLSQLERADLRIGLLAQGAARVAEVAALATAREGASADLPLPVRAGIATDGEGAARAHRRVLPRRLLDAAIARARDLLERLRGLDEPPARGELAERAGALRELAHEALGWRDGDPGASELASALAAGALGPPGLAVDCEELLLLLERELAREGLEPLGGAGGGVQVLHVTEARARCFDRLYVLGLARDAFPRAIAEDPLLPDPLRSSLRVLLPDLPHKRDGHDEERFLFAQLAAASPEVALLASTCDDDGRARELSPLVERLRRAPDVRGPEPVVAASSPAALLAEGLRPAHERALLAGLYACERDFEALLRVAIEEARRGEGLACDGAEALAGGRAAVLHELDHPAHRAAPLGPYFGFVGPLGAGADPRRGPIAITTLEKLVRCPWQCFLGQVLRIEAPPDAGGELPAADPRRVGSLVHRVLEHVAGESLGARRGSLAEASARDGVAIAWPSPEELEAIAREVAREMLRDEGVALPGFERVLALAAREPLRIARELDLHARELDLRERAEGLLLLGTEVEATLAVADARGAARELGLRVDRVDRRGEALWLTDYKTGRPKLAQARESARREGLLREIGAGRLLQAPAYAALARSLGGAEGLGRQLHLHADASDETRELRVEAGDAEVSRALEGSVARALAAWDAGSFFPRLLDADLERENGACSLCTVKEACLRGDSSARGRLRRWAEEPHPSASGAEAALLGILQPGEPG